MCVRWSVGVGGTEPENCIACSVISLPPGSHSVSLPPPPAPLPFPAFVSPLLPPSLTCFLTVTSAASQPPSSVLTPDCVLTSIFVPSTAVRTAEEKRSRANVHILPYGNSNGGGNSLQKKNVYYMYILPGKGWRIFTPTHSLTQAEPSVSPRSRGNIS